MIKLIQLVFLAIAGVAVGTSAWAHSVAEDAEAGIKVLFETGPLPAMTQQKSEMVFLIRDLNAEQGADPVAGLIENVEVVIHYEDKVWGPFAVKEGQRNPGRIALEKVFAYAGEYEVELSFNKTGDDRRITLHWDTDIGDWGSLVLQ